MLNTKVISNEYYKYTGKETYIADTIVQVINDQSTLNLLGRSSYYIICINLDKETLHYTHKYFLDNFTPLNSTEKLLYV